MSPESYIEVHEPTGTMHWPASASILNPNIPSASTIVCDLPVCQQEASEWVKDITGHPGEFAPFQDGAGA